MGAPDTWHAVVVTPDGRYEVAEIARGTIVYRTREEADRKAVTLRLERDFGPVTPEPSTPPWTVRPDTPITEYDRPTPGQHDGMPF